ncbi:hypothetical protein ACFYXW_27835 [Streptomyces sp. NPDC001981]|uniref:hypothetical protein n=1 Tax=Streptomyces sp. NPDC001981 TaxID=3364628 RepID=UPI0036825055
MSGIVKRILALMVSALASAFVALGWGVVLRLLGEAMVDCVKDGAGAGGGTFVLAVAVIMLFPFKDDPGTGGTPPVSSSPRAPVT